MQPVVPQSENPGKFTRFRTRLEQLRDRFESEPYTRFDSQIALIIAILLYLAVTIPSASRHLWFDELHTYWIAQAPTLTDLFNDFAVDLNPPLTFLAARASVRLFGDSALATRLPFVIAYLIGSLCLYKFLSQRLRPVYGLLAMLVFWSTPFFYFASEARPYAFVVGFFGVATLAWERAIQPRRSNTSVVILGLAVLGMMFSHFFSLFYICPFCCVEFWRYYKFRKFDWPIWVALLLPCVVPLVYLSVIRRYESSAFAPVQQASPFKLFAFFYHTLEPEGFVLLMAICVALAVAFRRERKRTPISALLTPIDTVFTLGLLAIPVLLDVVLTVTGGVFFPRYGIPALFAYGLLLAFFVAMYTNISRLAAAAACCVLLISIAGTTVVSATLDTLRTWGRKTAASVQQPRIEAVRPDLPLVAASGLTFLEMNKYESPRTVARLYYLTDRSLALRYAHATIFEGMPDLKKHFSLRGNVEPYKQFVAEHSHFLVLGTPDYSEDWLLRRLMDIHAKLEYLGSFKIPYKDQEIFEITMPSTSESGT